MRDQLDAIIRSAKLDLIDAQSLLEERGNVEAAKLAGAAVDAVAQVHRQLIEDFKGRVGVYSV